MNKTYTIGEVSKILNITPYSIRFYDQKKLIPTLKKDDHNNRAFTQLEIEWIYTIQILRKSGMSLKDVENYINLVMIGDSTLEERAQIMKNQKKNLKNKLIELKEMIRIIDCKIDYYNHILEDNVKDNLFSESIGKIIEEYEKSNSN